jgi:hypothetical protein
MSKIERRLLIAHGSLLSATPELPPYLVLLRVGFALPVALLSRRCALTAPFHPYPGVAAEAVCFLWHFPSSDPVYVSLGALPDVIRHTALRSSDFPPSSLDATRATARSGCLQSHYTDGEVRNSQRRAGLDPREAG